MKIRIKFEEDYGGDHRTASLEDARKWLRGHFETGAECPCCRQFVKLYNRPLTGAMARGLITLYHEQRRRGVDKWIHIPSLFREHKVCSSNDGALLRHWGLIEQLSGERPDGSKRIGYYRMTQKGYDFVEDRIRVLKYIWLYNQDPLPPRNNETVNIREALGTKFNYEEIMDPNPIGYQGARL